MSSTKGGHFAVPPSINAESILMGFSSHDLPSPLLPLAVLGIQEPRESLALQQVLSLHSVLKVHWVPMALGILELRRNQVHRQVLEVLAVLWTQWR